MRKNIHAHIARSFGNFGEETPIDSGIFAKINTFPEYMEKREVRFKKEVSSRYLFLQCETNRLNQ